MTAVSETENEPVCVYVWTGFCSVEVPPSPNDHDQSTGPPRDWSVKETARGTVPVRGTAAKFAITGSSAEVTVMYPGTDLVSVADPSRAVRLTVKAPARV